MNVVRMMALCLALAGAVVVGVAQEPEPITPTQAMDLFDGKSFDGWKLFLPDAAADVTKTWSAGDGVIRCTGQPAGYMRTVNRYRNYRFHAEWRWPANPGNNGVLVHVQLPDKVWPKMIEAQLMNQNAGDIWIIETTFREHKERGQDRRTPKLGPANEKPLGEWNNYDIVASGDTVILSVNGKVMNIATDCELDNGYICLQSEGAPIEFRNVRITPLNH